MTRRSDIDAALQAIYDQIPAMAGCKGHCWISCGPVPMSDRERQRLRERGFRVTSHNEARASDHIFWCEALTGDGKCGAYDMRPAQCRIWGTERLTPCPYGCQPGQALSTREALRLFLESLAAGGGQDLGVNVREEDIPAILERAREHHDALERLISSHQGDEIRMARYGTTIPPEVAKRGKLRR